jgi:hypothetical protein
MNYLNQNSGLKPDNIYKFSLPVVKTCIGAQECIKFCYARKGHYRTFAKTVDKAHDRNYEFSKSKEFVKVIAAEIVNRQIYIIRIHDTGDFYSQEYLDKWTLLAKHLKPTRFYAYTKSLQLDFSKFTKLSNTKIIKSFGGKFDSQIDLQKPHAKVFENLGSLWRKNYVDCSTSDLIALETKNPKIGLINH